MTLHTLFVSLLLVMAVSCQKKLDEVQTPSSVANNPGTANKIAPDGFTYQTSKTVTVSVNALTNDNKPMNGVPMNLYTLNKEGLLDKLVMKGFTNASGIFSTSITIPSYCDTLIIDPSYVGLVRYAKLALNSSSINCTIGGSQGSSPNIIGTLIANNEDLLIVNKTIKYQTDMRNSTIKTFDINGTKTNTKFIPLGDFTTDGLPKYLESSNDKISSEMLESINASLPEQTKVPNLHPEFISSSTASNITIEKDAEVWVTFVHEGAGYKNTLGYYTYKTGNAPKSLADIESIYYVLPICSLKGSGGSMSSGDKVKLGTFPAGTTVGLVLFANGWNGNVNTTYTSAFFTNENLNPETKSSLKRHNVFLQFKDTYLIGFEDINRESSGCDQDFNDLIIYATSNPIEAISTINVQPADTPTDSDGDGVSDTFDAYPKDPERAYINYFPAKDVYGTLAFEDLWPYKGDYDLNDLVVKYNYALVSNGKNQAVDLIANYIPVASGASFKNGFGVDLGITGSLIKSVEGFKHSQGYIKMASSGLEAEQSNAVIIPFDDAQNLLKNGGGNFSMNTFMEQPFVKAETISMLISFQPGVTTTAGTANSLIMGNFNPFLISNMKRGAEVHLPVYKPTKLADLSLLGQGNDATNPAAGIFYVTKENYPWALNFTENFQYPTEGTAINEAYLHFFDWAASGGIKYKDWYSNIEYRKTSLIYTK